MIDLVRDRELLELAQREAAGWFDRARPSHADVDKLVTSWQQRFRLVEIG